MLKVACKLEVLAKNGEKPLVPVNQPRIYIQSYKGMSSRLILSVEGTEYLLDTNDLYDAIDKIAS